MGGEIMSHECDRRDFMKKSVVTGVGAVLGSMVVSGCQQQGLKNPPPQPVIAPPMDKVRIGYVGVGGMGTAHVRNLLKIDGAEIRAVCDIVESKVARAQKMVEEAGFQKPEGYSRGEVDFKRLCQRGDLDLVYNATPWKWHVPISLEAMNTGKHAATEVPAAVTLDDCWQLVETAEKTGKYCMLMENCNYDRVEMIILNMVKKGLLGELLHAECGYLHDLRGLKWSDQGEGIWRPAHSIERNGDLYPTHGLGPVAQCLDINRGNRFDYLVSMSTKTRGLNLFAEKAFGPDSPQARQKFALGDVVTTLIRTAKGETIVLSHDTNTPRPYSRDILVQGTHGLVRKYPTPKIHVEGRSPQHGWENLDNYLDEYYHPLWKQMEERSKGAGHGGMDFLEDYRLINALLKGIEPDMDVYDAVALSSVCELSERSIAKNGEPIKFPDFTRGMWKENRPLPVMKIDV